MLLPLLGLGFVMGVRHSLEADHLAAVASMAVRTSSARETLKVAVAWGMGHAGALALVSAVLLGVDAALPERVARGLESTAGAALLVLGADALLRAWRGRAPPAAVTHHAHPHLSGGAVALLPRALLVGSVHGLAGTGALMVLALQSLRSGLQALTYVLTFGLGALAGMALFSLALCVPLERSARRLAGSARALEVTVALANLGLGAWILS